MKDKRKRVLVSVVVLIVVIATLGAGFLVYQNYTQCHETLGGGCLPAGQCTAPNGTIVDCEKLRQN